MTNKLIKGIIPVIPTPFTENEELDLEALERLVDFAAKANAAAVCLPAYASEFYKLTDSERGATIRTAIKGCKGRLPLLAQSNDPSPRRAAEIARRNADWGAEVIAFAIPRQFALPEDEILRYCETVAKAVTIPVFVQDFNPGGATVSADFAARLQERAENFQYLKLEEPLMGAKVMAIRQVTRDRVGVFEGWGGMYLLELMSVGISGAVPGLAMCDLFARVFDLASSGNLAAAMTIYRSLLPQIVFCLQSMELYHHCEKRLLCARGLLSSTVVRSPTLRLDANTEAHIDFLNNVVLAELDRQNFRRS
ncbi:MAG: dihydrodipicolinate synthase family protein [Terriglobia bacterium]|jgi:4-hydroxy-tetrahydrodipicolinate synthase